MAVQAGVPIVPIVLANYHELYSSKEKRFNPGTLRCRGKFIDASLFIQLVLTCLVSSFTTY